MTLEQRIEKITEVLPSGWSIALHVGNNSAWVNVEKPDGSIVPIIDELLDLSELMGQAVNFIFDEEAHNRNKIRQELGVKIKCGPFGCGCQTLKEHVLGDGCEICNPELAAEIKENA